MPSPAAVVLDTNVVVAAAFNRGSASARLVERIRRGALRLVWDDATRDETEHIVGKIPPLARSPILDVFRPDGRFDGATDPAAFAHVADPDDRKFAALAAAAGAVLVTMDEHLLAGRDRAAVRIATPHELIAELGDDD